MLFRVGIPCVAAVSFPFPDGDRISERRSTPGVRKNWGEVGRGEREGGVGGEKRNPSLASPLPLLLIFRTLSQFPFLRVSFSSHSLPDFVPFAYVFGNTCYAG